MDCSVQISILTISEQQTVPPPERVGSDQKTATAQSGLAGSDQTTSTSQSSPADCNQRAAEDPMNAAPQKEKGVESILSPRNDRFMLFPIKYPKVGTS